MSKQVKPFSVPYTIGYRTFVRGEDFLEEEGPTYWDGEPKLGDIATLSDGQQWKVCKESNDQMEITMELCPSQPST